ncbi:MAG: bifunctional phosphopantothenoylcysteine decarboxylase/phosphopantothenate--cysteine ligase CoaBC [Alphaproteobacteria bacterium]|nr:bifunctional phosphopantothenoylcysteine decarboxylase/phosphopantothenate--cysteine ligase CoaBC [Alphaproteobacteria bacterium]
MTLNKTILLIISGSIAAYKSAELCRLLKKQGARVIPILTKGGSQFITPLTISALCEEKCYMDLFSLTDEAQMGHIRLARTPDAIVVAPASANFIARINHGMADDLASSVILASNKPIFIAPAMNPFMYENQATQDNISNLQKRGVQLITPDAGDTACGETGIGRMAEIEMIYQQLEQYFAKQSHSSIGALSGALAGKKVTITAGGTSEPIDPVRIITNRSTGMQGFLIAKILNEAGASVTLIYGNVTQKIGALPDNITKIHAETADDMLQQVEQSLPCDIFISAAAVSDWKMQDYSHEKIKKQKTGDTATHQITLTETVDILKHIAHHTTMRPALVVGFAAETENLKQHSQAKFLAKNCDMMIANQVGADTGFGNSDNAIYFLQKDGGNNANNGIKTEQWQKLNKAQIAEQLRQKIIGFFD